MLWWRDGRSPGSLRLPAWNCRRSPELERHIQEEPRDPGDQADRPRRRVDMVVSRGSVNPPTGNCSVRLPEERPRYRRDHVVLLESCHKGDKGSVVSASGPSSAKTVGDGLLGRPRGRRPSPVQQMPGGQVGVAAEHAGPRVAHDGPYLLPHHRAEAVHRAASTGGLALAETAISHAGQSVVKKYGAGGAEAGRPGGRPGGPFACVGCACLADSLSVCGRGACAVVIPAVHPDHDLHGARLAAQSRRKGWPGAGRRHVRPGQCR